MEQLAERRAAKAAPCRCAVPIRVFCTVLAALSAFSAFAEVSSAKALVDKALADNASGAQTVSATLASLEQAVLTSPAPSDTRSLYIFIGSLQEQRGFYAEASRSYAVAAGIIAENATGMPQISAEQLMINAVRCALSAGDHETAEAYLNTATVRQVADPFIAAYAKLYAVWYLIVKADGGQRMKEAVELLKQYTAAQSNIEPVCPAVLLTLWRIVGDAKSGETLATSYPHSPEAAIVSGKAELLETPLWCFCSKRALPPDTTSAQSEQRRAAKQHAGLFKSRINAEQLTEALRTKGFTATIAEETRESGTAYYIVTIPENADGTAGTLLRSAGFDCYPIYGD